MALGVVRDLRSPRSLDAPGEAAAYQEHLMAEYVLARLAHGVTDGTIRGEITAVEQFLEHAGVFAWEIEPGHVLRHACASRLYGEGIGLAAIQQLLGHRWLSTTVRYVHVADEAIEHAYQQAAERAAARFKE